MFPVSVYMVFLATALQSLASIVVGLTIGFIFFLYLQATGSRLATALQSLASIVMGLTIGFVFSWKLSLVILSFAPFIFLSGAARVRTMSGKTIHNQKALEEAGKVTVLELKSIIGVAKFKFYLRNPDLEFYFIPILNMSLNFIQS